MGIKVLLVDDEKLERVLIRKGFDWNGNGFEIIGEASSGKEALEYVERWKPEIVITDISMPHMDGLELSEQILKIIPNCHIVIVTGYREFDYARRAVKVGVEDFLLKPVNIQDIADVTKRIKEKICKNQEQVKEVEKLKENILANQDVVLESFFQRLVEKRIEEQEAQRKLKLYHCENLMESCICVNLRLKDDAQENRSAERGFVLELISKNNYKNSVCFVHYMHSIILYFAKQEASQIQGLIPKLHEEINTKLAIKVTIGISRLHKGFEGIAQAFEESEKALSASVLIGRNRCVTYEEYEEIMKQNQEQKELDWEDFIFVLTHCLKEKVLSYVEEYVSFIRVSKVTEVEYLKLMTMNFLSKAEESLGKYGMSLLQLIGEEKLYAKIGHMNSIDEMEEFLKEQLHTIMDYHGSKKVRQGNKVVEEALVYVNENLFDPDVSLKVVAAHIFTNESYLSRVFKKEMDLSLIEYISKKRIEESIRLFNSTDLKVYEVAEKIGFRDSHYFSICFKKHTGVTVKEFKKVK